MKLTNKILDDMMNESMTSLNKEIEKTINSISESNDDSAKQDKTVINIVKKLISEETISHDLYVGSIVAAEKEASQCIRNLFAAIASDELNDHCRKLVEWALCHEIDVPFKHKDYVSCAGKSSVKQLDGLKTKKDANYYIDEAIKAEEDSIKSYEEAMKNSEIPYDLNTILMQNYYDELDHVKKLNTLKIACKANAQLAWI